jgi:hypothetical protein
MAKPTMTQAVQEVWAAAQQNTANGLPTLEMDEVAADNPQYPVAVYKHTGEVPQYEAGQMGNAPAGFVDGRFQIVLNVEQLAACEALALIVMGIFTPFSLSLSSGQINTLMRKNYTLHLVGRDASGNELYEATIDYLCKIGAPSV